MICPSAGPVRDELATRISGARGQAVSRVVVTRNAILISNQRRPGLPRFAPESSFVQKNFWGAPRPAAAPLLRGAPPPATPPGVSTLFRSGPSKQRTQACKQRTQACEQRPQGSRG